LVQTNPPQEQGVVKIRRAKAAKEERSVTFLPEMTKTPDEWALLAALGTGLAIKGALNGIALPAGKRDEDSARSAQTKSSAQ
jgi:hypothetical protein